MKRAASLPTLLVGAFAVTSCSDEPAGLVSSKGPSFSVGQEPGTWAVLAPVPKRFVGVEGMSVAPVGDRIIAALGFDNGDTRTTRIYDIASNTWSFGADAPGASAEGAGASGGASSSHGGLMYNIGGRHGFGGPPRADIWSYDPASNTWNASLAPMNTARAGLAVAWKGNALFAIGGRSTTNGPCSGGGTRELASVERYDIDANVWTTVAPLPSPRSDLAAATVGGKIYVFGGCRGPQNILSDVDVYDPVTNTWSSAPTDMPTRRAAMYAVETNGGTVYVIGGHDGVRPLSTNEAYKVAQDLWTTGLPPMPTARAEAGAAGHNGKVYILGGDRPPLGASVDANEAFKPSGLGH